MNKVEFGLEQIKAMEEDMFKMHRESKSSYLVWEEPEDEFTVTVEATTEGELWYGYFH